MGQWLCCLRPPTDGNQSQNVSWPALSGNPKGRNLVSSDEQLVDPETVMTLEEYLMNSPALNPHCIRECETQVFKQPSRRVYPSSPDFSNTQFYTPRMSFSSGKLEKIDERLGEGDDKADLYRASSTSRSGSMKLKKKVTFKLPEEADIITFYTPRETFD